MKAKGNHMKHVKLLLIVCCVAVGAAQTPEGVASYWPAAKLKGYSSILKPRMPMVIDGKTQMVAAERLVNYGDQIYIAYRRDESSEPEIHGEWTDIDIGQEGEATIVYGGKIEGGRTTSEPGEIKGGKIVGGITQKMVAGDVVVIPPGVPHQTLIETGKSWTALMVKIKKK